MDKVFLEDLALDTVIGVFPWEKEIKQRLLLSVELVYDLHAAGLSDNVADTIRYDEVAKVIRETAVENEPVELLETLAEKITQALFGQFPASTITLRINKGNIVEDVRNVGIEITRQR